ncbi:hypothetical protein HK096_011329, partial [Nowakowskiella sp. JEL0078]
MGKYAQHASFPASVNSSANSPTPSFNPLPKKKYRVTSPDCIEDPEDDSILESNSQLGSPTILSNNHFDDESQQLDTETTPTSIVHRIVLKVKTKTESV